MRRVIWILIGFIAFTACKKKDIDMTVVSKNLFEGVEFTEISVNDAWPITIVIDGQNLVELEYSAYLEDYLNVKQSGKTVSIGNGKYYNMPYNTVRKAVIHLKTLEKLNAKEACICRGGSFTGHVSITLEEASHLVDCDINSDDCEIQIKGASSLKGDVTADSLNMVMDDASRMITYSGQVKNLRLTMTDCSILNMINTPVEEAYVELNEASEATLWVTTKLQGTLRDVSRLYYKGLHNPEVECDSTSFVQKLNN